MTSPFTPVQSFTPFPAAAGARILSFGGYQPGNVVTNDDLAAQVDTNDEWIRSRVGIVSRRFAGPDESVADMAVQAGGKALAGSGLSPADVDLVIVAPTSGTFRPPAGRFEATATGAMVALTAELGTVVTRGGERPVAAPWPAEIIEWLVEDGDPVSEGQPLVRVLPREGV